MVVTPDTTAQIPAAPVLGDVMHLNVIAERGPLLRLHVRRDTADLEAHWVNEGDSLVIEARNRIVLENGGPSNALGRAALRLENRPWLRRPRGTPAQLVITRAAAIAYLDSLRQAGQ